MSLRQLSEVGISLISLLVASATCGFGETDPDTLQIFDSRDTIRVVADRFEVSLKELAYTYHLAERQEIQLLSQHSALEMVDLVNPSAFTLEKNIMGYGAGSAGAGIISIRGLGGRPNTGMLVLVNGHPDFMGLFGHPLPDVYGVDDVAQVEILSGPASAMFGSQALGGVINIKSGPEYAFPVKVSVAGGSYSSYNIGLLLNRRINRHGFSLTVRQRATDGHIDKSSFKAVNLQTGWYYTISPVWQLDLQARYVPYEFDDPTRNEANDKLGIYAKIRRGMSSLTLKNNHPRLQGSTQVFNNLGHHRFSDGFESHDYSWGVSTYQQREVFPELNLAGGAEFIRYGGKSNVKDPEYIEDSFGIYMLGFYTFSSVFNLKAGLRYQYSSLDFSMITPVAGLGINLLSNLQFYANYQSGFRYPTISELYMFPPSNPDLEEERVNSVEAGLVFYWQGKNHARIAAYRNDASNMIQTALNPAPPPRMRYANSGAADQWGLEMELFYDITQWLSGQVGVSQMEPDRLTAFNPETQIKYQLSVRSGWFTAAFFGKYVEKLYAANDYNAPLPDYNVLNLVVSGHYSNWTLNLHLVNLLDRAYMSFPDYPAPGFHFMAGLTYSMF